MFFYSLFFSFFFVCEITIPSKKIIFFLLISWSVTKQNLKSLEFLIFFFFVFFILLSIYFFLFIFLIFLYFGIF